MIPPLRLFVASAIFLVAPGVFSEPFCATAIVGGKKDCDRFGEYYGQPITPSEFNSNLNQPGGVWKYLSSNQQVVFCSQNSLTEYRKVRAQERNTSDVGDVFEFISDNAAVVPTKMVNPFFPNTQQHSEFNGLFFAFQHQLGEALNECKNRRELASCVNKEFVEVGFEGVFFETRSENVLYLRGTEHPLVVMLRGKYMRNHFPFHPELADYMSKYVDDIYKNDGRFKGFRLTSLISSGFWLKSPQPYLVKYIEEYISPVAIDYPGITDKILFDLKMVDGYLNGWNKSEALSFLNAVSHFTASGSNIAEQRIATDDLGMMLAGNINAWARFKIEEIDGKISEDRLSYYAELASSVDLALPAFETGPYGFYFYDQLGLLAGSIYRHGVDRALVSSPSFQKFFLRELENGGKIFSKCSQGASASRCIALSWAAQDFYYRLQGKNFSFDAKALNAIKVALNSNCTNMKLQIPFGVNGSFPRYSCEHSLMPLSYSTPMIHVPWD